MGYVKNKQGDLIEQDNYNWGYMRMFEDFVANASPEIQEEIMECIERARHRDICPWGTKAWTDWDKAADLGDKYNGWGRNLLYVWLNSDGIPFYVGQAVDSARPSQFKYKTRSEAFRDVIREGGCHSVVVAKHIPQSKIDNLEKELISYFCWKEYPVVNAQGLPSSMECRMAKKIAKAGNMSVEDVFLCNTEHDREFKAIFSVLDKVVGQPWNGECAKFPT